MSPHAPTSKAGATGQEFDSSFDCPVTVETGRIGRYRVVGNTREAAKLLLGRWPQSRGNAYSAALQCCLDVSNGVRTPGEARHAFIEAAIEARVLISVTDEFSV